jgi:peptide/nickel transport system substrate-binding protein
MKKLLVILFAASASLFITSCGGGADDENQSTQGKGGVYYGGVFRMNETENFRDLYPLNVTEVVSQRITNQIYEGLVKLDQADLKIIPSIAEKWEKNEDATVWTFYMRKGVMFHDDSCFAAGKGREVKAQDFKWCFDKLCEASVNNQQYYVTFKDRVVGADEYFKSTEEKKPLAGGVSGVKVIDDYTLQVTLKFPFAGFENILAMPGCWVYPHEAFESYGEAMRAHCVGTGPFKVNTIVEGDVVLLEKNTNYWQIDEYGNKLPYLQGVKFFFKKEKKQEFLMFRNGELDMIFRIPNEMFGEILAEQKEAKDNNRPFELQNCAAMATYYYGFLNPSAPFDKKEIRMAFNLAIDREKIVKFTLKGDGLPATHGAVPELDAFKSKGFNYDNVKGYAYDPDKARKLLADAGFAGGKGFPKIVLQINSGGGDRNVLIAQAIKGMLQENLGVEAEIDQIPFAEHLQKLETGKTLFWRQGWIADYPDPETFLTLFLSTHVPAKMDDRSTTNPFRFKSAKFDSLFLAAMKETDEKKRFELYSMADAIVTDEAPFMPLVYDESYRLIQTNVKNFPVNAMEYRDLTKTYFVPKKENKKK